MNTPKRRSAPEEGALQFGWLNRGFWKEKNRDSKAVFTGIYRAFLLLKALSPVIVTPKLFPGPVNSINNALYNGLIRGGVWNVLSSRMSYFYRILFSERYEPQYA